MRCVCRSTWRDGLARLTDTIRCPASLAHRAGTRHALVDHDQAGRRPGADGRAMPAGASSCRRLHVSQFCQWARRADPPGAARRFLNIAPALGATCVLRQTACACCTLSPPCRAVPTTGQAAGRPSGGSAETRTVHFTAPASLITRGAPSAAAAAGQNDTAQERILSPVSLGGASTTAAATARTARGQHDQRYSQRLAHTHTQ